MKTLNYLFLTLLFCGCSCEEIRRQNQQEAIRDCLDRCSVTEIRFDRHGFLQSCVCDYHDAGRDSGVDSGVDGGPDAGSLMLTRREYCAAMLGDYFAGLEDPEHASSRCDFGYDEHLIEFPPRTRDGRLCGNWKARRYYIVCADVAAAMFPLLFRANNELMSSWTDGGTE